MKGSFALRLRAHEAGLADVAARVAGGGRDPEDLLALLNGPLPLLARLGMERAPKAAAVVGLLPITLGADVAETVRAALAHRASKEAEVAELRADGPCTTGALDQACEILQRLVRELPGLVGRIDEASLHALAAGAGLTPEGAASRLSRAGFVEVTAERIPTDAPGASLPLPVREAWEIPPQLGAEFVQACLQSPRALFLRQAPETTGIQLLRAVALARICGHGPIAVGGVDELKGPDGALAFGADRLEAELDPPGTLGSRTRAYGEAAVAGAQLRLVPPRRSAVATKRAAHILDEEIDPSLLPGGEPAKA